GDPSDLFRQYIRFMIEMQWLLSILVPSSSYPVIPGIALLEESDDPLGGRCDKLILSRAIHAAWEAIRRSSARLTGISAKGGSRGKPVLQVDLEQGVDTLRDLIGWKALEPAIAEYKSKENLPPPALHAIGYSLGGYLAQSLFFTWPFALSSCTTLCSGGALHDLGMVKFAHTEEWRAVTHGLKYEIESGMLQGRLAIDPKTAAEAADDPGSVCGIPASAFSSHFRIFNEVFLQDPHGSYRSRVSEFAPRLLFLVGGNDPIVTMKSVLDASPREGINIIEIANLSHFVATESGEWRDSWLPAVARVLSSFADRTSILLA